MTKTTLTLSFETCSYFLLLLYFFLIFLLLLLLLRLLLLLLLFIILLLFLLLLLLPLPFLLLLLLLLFFPLLLLVFVLILLLLPGAELPSWNFWPSQCPLSTSLDPGRKQSSFLFSFDRYPVCCYPPICTWDLCDLLVRGMQLNIFLNFLVSGNICT